MSTAKRNTLFVVNSASDVARKQMTRGTKIIREDRYLRVNLVTDKGKILASDSANNADTGVLFQIEESVLAKPEFTAGILSHTSHRVETRSLQFFVFGTPEEMHFYADGSKKIEVEFPIEDTVMVAQIKNLLYGKVQNQWRATKTELEDLRK